MESSVESRESGGTPLMPMPMPMPPSKPRACAESTCVESKVHCCRDGSQPALAVTPFVAPDVVRSENADGWKDTEAGLRASRTEEAGEAEEAAENMERRKSEDWGGRTQQE